MVRRIPQLLDLLQKMIADFKVQSQDTVAYLGSNALDVLRADCRGSDNLVAGDRDDLVGAAAR